MSKTESVKTDSSTQKIGLERFLKLVPQKRGIAAIMRRRYAMEVHTKAEWEAIVENVLNRKVK